jgi:dethiobiotin synthetase
LLPPCTARFKRRIPLKLFITGTDTGIGKTWVSAAIAAKALNLGRSVGYYKPIQTGTPVGLPPEDPHFIETLFGASVRTYNRYNFVPPVTPSVADTEGVIDMGLILKDVAQFAEQSELLLVEGAGGLAVPVTPDLLMVDLIQTMSIPVVLVASCQLGTINHTLLSVEALKRRNIQLLGIVLNNYPQDLHTSELAIQTLKPTLRQHLDDDIPLWTCLSHEGPTVTPADLQIDLPIETAFLCNSL